MRPELDTAPVGVVARVGRLAAFFDQSTERLMASFDLSRASWDVLASLRRVGPPFERTPTELYQALMRSSGWMTNRLHRLERAGLVERRADPADARSVKIRLTDRGVRLVDEIAPQHLANEQRMLVALPPAAREELAGLLRTLLVALEATQPLPPRAKGR